MRQLSFRSAARSSSARVVLATTAVATLAIIAACSEGGVAGNVAAPSVRAAGLAPIVLANASLAHVCVDSLSPAGTYSFVNHNHSFGAGGTTVENVADGVVYTLTKNVGNPNPCADVLTRTSVTDTTALSDNFSQVTVKTTGTPGGVDYLSTTCEIDAGNIPTSPCTDSATVHANKFHGSKTTFRFAPGRIPTPLFVIGDVEPHSPGIAGNVVKGGSPIGGDIVNFWGAQWWKNNQMSQFTSNGYPSFKGYADTADNFCGGTWTSRPGNSSKPPETIGDDVAIIVTSNVWKFGPNISGNIKEILIVHQDGGYGPNPGHRGNGPVTTVLCSLDN